MRQLGSLSSTSFVPNGTPALRSLFGSESSGVAVERNVRDGQRWGRATARRQRQPTLGGEGDVTVIHCLGRVQRAKESQLRGQAWPSPTLAALLEPMLGAHERPNRFSRPSLASRQREFAFGALAWPPNDVRLAQASLPWRVGFRLSVIGAQARPQKTISAFSRAKLGAQLTRHVLLEAKLGSSERRADGRFERLRIQESRAPDSHAANRPLDSSAPFAERRGPGISAWHSPHHAKWSG